MLRAMLMACSSVSARWSVTPEVLQCSCAPPRSSALTSSPVAACTSEALLRAPASFTPGPTRVPPSLYVRYMRLRLCQHVAAIHLRRHCGQLQAASSSALTVFPSGCLAFPLRDRDNS